MGDLSLSFSLYFCLIYFPHPFPQNPDNFYTILHIYLLTYFLTLVINLANNLNFMLEFFWPFYLISSQSKLLSLFLPGNFSQTLWLDPPLTTLLSTTLQIRAINTELNYGLISKILGTIWTTITFHYSQYKKQTSFKQIYFFQNKLCKL